MASVIYAYLTDPAFVRRNTPLPNYLKYNGGIGIISQVGLSYFLDVAMLADKRDPASRDVNIPHPSGGALLFDGEFDSDATTLLENVPQSTINAIFAITDRIFFSGKETKKTADIEADLLSNKDIASILVPKTLRLPESQVTGSYYDDTGNAQSYSTWPYLVCDLSIPVGSTTVTQTFHIFCEDMAWRKGYPHSTIMSVTPPLSYSDLISLPLNTAQGNEIAVVTNAMNMAMQNFGGPQSQETATGGMVFSLRAVGPNGIWTIMTPWGILYKGQQPTVTQIRAAIRTACENSNTATPDQWKQRFPDLYIIGRYYIVPLWDQTYQLTDSQIFKGIFKDNDILDKLSNIFPAFSTDYINKSVEYFTSPYDFIHLASIIDPGSVQDIGPLNKRHPTYRELRVDDPSFSYMDKLAQQFSSNLIECLAIFSKTSQSSILIPYSENGLTYIPFSIDQVEYAILSPETYASAQGVYQ